MRGIVGPLRKIHPTWPEISQKDIDGILTGGRLIDMS